VTGGDTNHYTNADLLADPQSNPTQEITKTTPFLHSNINSKLITWLEWLRFGHCSTRNCPSHLSQHLVAYPPLILAAPGPPHLSSPAIASDS